MDPEEAMIKALTSLQFLNATIELREHEEWTTRDVITMSKAIIASHCLKENMSLHEFTEILMEFQKDYQILIEKSKDD